ncbi:DUF983 domain-containing protein [Novosphingobium sp. Leaf2]|uniref:DUF983 domain-containing protein n=1 Tax=Novosphingobium sp. Leaf2 TaxID=1735670 RepID=UPI0006F65EEF|nr:DUF983 domain-containing protein [Novosphingobium sp. Leaf2]KQM18315.1 hypothetical protein ASE49_08835 [Novosphingobium sp. Leaf2]
MTDSDPSPSKGQPGTASAALLGCCPRCGERTLFSSLVTFSQRCRACDLDFERFNVGDGPAAFLTLIIGTLVAVMAIWLHLSLAPPWWVHVILWVPLSLGLTLAGLRVTKAWLLGIEYRRKAGESRFKDQ